MDEHNQGTTTQPTEAPQAKLRIRKPKTAKQMEAFRKAQSKRMENIKRRKEEKLKAIQQSKPQPQQQPEPYHEPTPQHHEDVNPLVSMFR